MMDIELSGSHMTEKRLFLISKWKLEGENISLERQVHLMNMLLKLLGAKQEESMEAKVQQLWEAIEYMG
jgi:hypothetical protein